MFKKRISKKEWILLFICIIIIAVVLLDSAIRKVYTKFSNLDEEIKRTEARLGRLSGVLGQREQIQSRHKAAIAGLIRINASDDFLEVIERTAEGIGFDIRNIKPAATQEEDSYRIYSVKIESQDEISTLARFLYIFSNEFNGIGLERLEINAQSQKELPKINLILKALEFKE